MLITRRANQPLALAVVGRVLASPQRALHVRTENARTFLAPMQPGDVTLGALALQSPMRAAGWRAGTDAAQADLVAVWSGATWFTFFFNDQVGHWQREGESTGNRDDFLILAGTPVMIHRRTAASGIAERTVVFPPSGG